MLESAQKTLGKVGRHFTETARRAFTKPSHDKDVTYEVLGKPSKKKPELTRENSAVYIGKLPYGFLDRLMDLRGKISGVEAMRIILLDFAKQFATVGVGIDPDDRIYSDEFLRTVVDFLFDHRKPGEKIRIVSCRALSELLNGEKDTQDMVSESGVSGKVAVNVGRDYEQNHGEQDSRTPLQVVAIDKIPANVGLFAQLRECKDPKTGVVDIEKAYGSKGTPTLSKDPTALEIAKFLYWACQQNPEVKEIFMKLRPGKIREQEDNYPESSKYYGLTEIAFRLRAILDGQEIHGGVGRQGVYDDVIIRIVKKKEKNNKYRKFTELLPLYKIFEGKNFETFHINTQENYHEQKLQKHLAWTRLYIYATLGAFATFGVAVPIKRHYIQKQDAAYAAAHRRPTAEEMDAYINNMHAAEEAMEKFDAGDGSQAVMAQCDQTHCQIWSTVPQKYDLPDAGIVDADK